MIAFFAVLGIAAAGWAIARIAALRGRTPGSSRQHSLPSHHGWYVALWSFVPAMVFLLFWFAVSPRLVEDEVLRGAPAALPPPGMEREAILAEARALAEGTLEAAFNPASEALVAPFRAAIMKYDLAGWIAAGLLAFSFGAFALTRSRPEFVARVKVERAVMNGLIAASLVALLTTIGIAVSLLFETIRFFSLVPAGEFFFGTVWSPKDATAGGYASGFGSVPLFWGTIFIGAIIAMCVAVPLGLMSAIYLTQYASASARRILKPALEVLAGVPTVVYGYFAALTIAPAVRDLAVAMGLENPSSESALAAGLVMGAMIIPFVCSMSDDSIAVVPQSIRDGSLALGATKSETILRAIVPAALPGITGGVLLAVSRAVGETMIVVMAAGLAANLTANPFASVTTVTVQIVQLLTGDQEFESAKTLAAFALGFALFVITLLLNIVALAVVRKYRETYE